MRPALAALAALAPSLLAAGCAHSERHYVSFEGPGAAPRPASAATELHIDTTPSRPYRELGLVQAVSYGGGTEDALSALRREGRRRGCDAVVKVRADHGISASHAAGVCVAWTDPPGR